MHEEYRWRRLLVPVVCLMLDLDPVFDVINSRMQDIIYSEDAFFIITRRLLVHSVVKCAE